MRDRPAGVAGAALALPRWSGGQDGSAGIVACASLRQRRCSSSPPIGSGHAPTTCLCTGCHASGQVALLLVVHPGSGAPSSEIPERRLLRCEAACLELGSQLVVRRKVSAHAPLRSGGAAPVQPRSPQTQL